MPNGKKGTACIVGLTVVIGPLHCWGWSGGAMVLGKLPVPGRPTIWMSVGQGPTALAVGAGGGCLDIFTLRYLFFPLSPSLWETARYRLKYCLKGPLNPKQPTNHSIAFLTGTLTFVFKFSFKVVIITNLEQKQKSA